MKIGEKFYFVPVKRRGDPYEAIITKIGKIYAYASKYNENDIKINMKGMFVDAGAYSPSTYIYESKELYELSIKAEKAFSHLKNSLGWTRNENISLEDIQQASKLLGIKPCNEDI